MKRPTESGWYWAQIPGRNREIVFVEAADEYWFADSAFEGESYEVFEIKGWRWLGRAVLEKEK